MSKHLEAEERKQQIIQTALMLFSQKGYEQTSIQEILDVAKISKGGFYHHYASKQDLLESIAQSFIQEIMTIVHSVTSRQDLTALEKLNLYVKRVNEFKQDRQIEVMSFIDELYRDDKNIRLESLVFQYSQRQLLPIMRQIVDQGCQEGEFAVEYPEECADMLTKMFLIHQKEMGSLFVKAMQNQDAEAFGKILRKYAFMQKTMESMLGIMEGTLNITDIAKSTLCVFKKSMQVSKGGRDSVKKGEKNEGSSN